MSTRAGEFLGFQSGGCCCKFARSMAITHYHLLFCSISATNVFIFGAGCYCLAPQGGAGHLPLERVVKTLLVIKPPPPPQILCHWVHYVLVVHGWARMTVRPSTHLTCTWRFDVLTWHSVDKHSEECSDLRRALLWFTQQWPLDIFSMPDQNVCQLPKKRVIRG